jgi:hypothetical protein
MVSIPKSNLAYISPIYIWILHKLELTNKYFSASNDEKKISNPVFPILYYQFRFQVQRKESKFTLQSRLKFSNWKNAGLENNT